MFRRWSPRGGVRWRGGSRVWPRVRVTGCARSGEVDPVQGEGTVEVAGGGVDRHESVAEFDAVDLFQGYRGLAEVPHREGVGGQGEAGSGGGGAEGGVGGQEEGAGDLLPGGEGRSQVLPSDEEEGQSEGGGRQGGGEARLEDAGGRAAAPLPYRRRHGATVASAHTVFPYRPRSRTPQASETAVTRVRAWPGRRGSGVWWGSGRRGSGRGRGWGGRPRRGCRRRPRRGRSRGRGR